MAIGVFGRHVVGKGDEPRAKDATGKGGTSTWKGAALARDLRPREIRPSPHAVSSRLERAAPANDPERRRSIGYPEITDRLRTGRWGKITLGNSREPPV